MSFALRRLRHVGSGRRKQFRVVEVVDVPVTSVRIWRFHRATAEASPLVNAALRLVECNTPTAIRELSDWYQDNQAISFSEWTGVCLSRSDIGDLPAWAVPMPWWTEVLEGRHRKALANIAHEAGKQLATEQEANLNWPSFGPVAPEVPSREVRRLASIIDAWDEILSRSEASELPVVRRLVTTSTEGDVWEVKSGNHRFACAAALGVPTMRCTVLEVAYERNSHKWKGVKDGSFTSDEAGTLFRSVVDGHPRSSIGST